jgi:hypothetical protein
MKLVLLTIGLGFLIAGAGLFTAHIYASIALATLGTGLILGTLVEPWK